MTSFGAKKSFIFDRLLRRILGRKGGRRCEADFRKLSIFVLAKRGGGRVILVAKSHRE